MLLCLRLRRSELGHPLDVGHWYVAPGRGPALGRCRLGVLLGLAGERPFELIQGPGQHLIYGVLLVALDVADEVEVHQVKPVGDRQVVLRDALAQAPAVEDVSSLWMSVVASVDPDGEGSDGSVGRMP